MGAAVLAVLHEESEYVPDFVPDQMFVFMDDDNGLEKLRVVEEESVGAKRKTCPVSASSSSSSSSSTSSSLSRSSVRRTCGAPLKFLDYVGGPKIYPHLPSLPEILEQEEADEDNVVSDFSAFPVSSFSSIDLESNESLVPRISSPGLIATSPDMVLDSPPVLTATLSDDFTVPVLTATSPDVVLGSSPVLTATQSDTFTVPTSDPLEEAVVSFDESAFLPRNARNRNATIFYRPPFVSSSLGARKRAVGTKEFVSGGCSSSASLKNLAVPCSDNAFSESESPSRNCDELFQAAKLLIDVFDPVIVKPPKFSTMSRILRKAPVKASMYPY